MVRGCIVILCCRRRRLSLDGRVWYFDRLTENRVWSVPVTVDDTRVGDAGVSGRVWKECYPLPK